MLRIEFFEGPWCPSCKGMKPNLIHVCNELNIPIEYIDAGNDGNAEYCIRQKINTLPTLVIFSDDTEVDRIIGPASRQEIHKRIMEAGKE